MTSYGFGQLQSWRHRFNSLNFWQQNTKNEKENNEPKTCFGHRNWFSWPKKKSSVVILFFLFGFFVNLFLSWANAK